MLKTQLILLRSCTADLNEAIRSSGAIECIGEPASPVVLTTPPTIIPETGRIPLSRDDVREVERCLALSCTFDSDSIREGHVRHQLELVAIALQLVKPAANFLELWLQLDHSGETEMVNRPVSHLGHTMGPHIYLHYQQHNCLTESDVRRAIGLLPRLSRALDPGHGSWIHPLVSVHRAVIFFCQGYSIQPSDASQFLWAAGLDCLYASKLDKGLQGSAEIGRRIQTLLGPTLKLYEADTVSIPIHQKGRTHKILEDVSSDIFKLRNAFAHGKPIPEVNWLADQGQPAESGYAYQLLEQTEIALRLTLLRILEDQTLFAIFADPARLDAYF